MIAKKNNVLTLRLVLYPWIEASQRERERIDAILNTVVLTHRPEFQRSNSSSSLVSVADSIASATDVAVATLDDDLESLWLEYGGMLIAIYGPLGGGDF